MHLKQQGVDSSRAQNPESAGAGAFGEASIEKEALLTWAWPQESPGGEYLFLFLLFILLPLTLIGCTRMKGPSGCRPSGGQPPGDRARWRRVASESEGAIKECPVQVSS